MVYLCLVCTSNPLKCPLPTVHPTILSPPKLHHSFAGEPNIGDVVVFGILCSIWMLFLNHCLQRVLFKQHEQVLQKLLQSTISYQISFSNIPFPLGIPHFSEGHREAVSPKPHILSQPQMPSWVLESYSVKFPLAPLGHE